jgi:hypothetical protein
MAKKILLVYSICYMIYSAAKFMCSRDMFSVLGVINYWKHVVPICSAFILPLKLSAYFTLTLKYYLLITFVFCILSLFLPYSTLLYVN